MKATFLTLAAVLLVPQPALAADGHSWKIGDAAFHIYYSDLDMNTADGRRQMLARVEKAARRLCVAPLKVDEEECVAATLRDAAGSAGGQTLAVALAERAAVRLAKK
jgi:UrcA family protein